MSTESATGADLEEATRYDGVGDLPDALAFVKPSRARFWLHLHEHDELVSAEQLVDETGLSSATIYRMLGTLQELNIVEAVNVYTKKGPSRRYRAVWPGDLERGDQP